MLRYDSAPIKNKKFYKDPTSGYLTFKDVPIARVGVFPYRNADGSYHMEAKLPEDLLNPDTVNSANNKALTDDHPGESVNTENSTQYLKGFTSGNAHVEDGKIKVDVTLTDSALIEEVEYGKEELSIGFATDTFPKSGEFKGTKYDTVQKHIRINHLAVVKRGRAGHTVRLTGDSAELVMDKLDSKKKESKQMEYTTVRLDGKDITVAKEDAAIVTGANDAGKDKDAQITALKKKIKDLEGDSEKTSDQAKKDKQKADSLEEENKTLKEKLEEFKGDALDEKIEAAVELRNKANKFLGDSYDFSGKSEREIKVAAIKTVDDSFNPEGKDESYISGLFDGLKPTESTSGVVGFKSNRADSLSDEAAVIEARKKRYGF
ncbi:DUF2213 domain-containing protein [Lactobacillus sp.]|uniref:DUF2213 domain-containing protein n=1 Tax=Lactobacillus sp. TaxID=1591 RepID=UPI00199F78D7|nr:DUF2213 domain-containing protein [Lactobacillus sp.]MBD5430135.1 DUF2213 domain-containing protein [Lactobacillus sp.]